MATEHYAYCKDQDCPGCLPSDEALQDLGFPLPLWVEMIRRCVAQTPQTKTREGAIAALVADGPKYRAHPRVVRP